MLQLIDLIMQGDYLFSHANNKEEYFENIGKMLIEKAVVKPVFLEELIKRESVYPTGIETKSIGVAIPHVENHFVLKNALYITVFENPIEFKRMDDVERNIEVKVAFLLLIEDTSIHMNALQQLVNLFIKDSELMLLLNCKTKDDVIAFLQERND